MNALPCVSVIVPSYNRENELCKLKDQLAQQTYANLEILIVDQSDIPSNVIHKVVQNDCPNVKVLRHRPPNTPAARNLGLLNAKGDIIVFLDDDVKIRYQLR